MVAPTPSTPAGDLVPAPRDDLCLNFANTRYWRGSDPPTETLNDLGDVIDWCGGGGVLGEGRGLLWRDWWHDRPSAATAAFGDAVALREAVYRTFRSVATGAEPAGEDVRALSEAMAGAPARAGIERTGTGFAWRVTAPTEPTAAALLAPVIWSAGDLLVGPRLGKVRQCANERCLWLFVDDSRNGTRRWCSMSSCGNRAKAHRHYVRRKGG